jgi:hypothetical protein
MTNIHPVPLWTSASEAEHNEAIKLLPLCASSGCAGSHTLAGDIARHAGHLLETAFIILALLEAVLWFSVLRILEDRDV